MAGEKLKNADERDQEIEALRDRLSSLTEASLRINESLDLDTVLQGGPGLRPDVDGSPLRGDAPSVPPLRCVTLQGSRGCRATCRRWWYLP